jgi:hypothetical protein
MIGVRVDRLEMRIEASLCRAAGSAFVQSFQVVKMWVSRMRIKKVMTINT